MTQLIVQKTKQRILYFPQSPMPFNEACLSLTPKVSSIQNSTFLDLEPTQKLFGGEKRLLSNATQLALHFHLPPQWVLTDRPEWARALCTENELVLPPGKSFERLVSLPLERLKYCGDPSTVENELSERQDLILFMKRVGMKLISDFIRLSPSAIGRRFGKVGVRLHEWALGHREVLLPPFIPETQISELVDTDELSDLESLIFLLQDVLLRIAARLKGRALIAKALDLKFQLASREALQKKLILSSPTQDGTMLLKWLTELLRTLSWDSPLIHLEIQVSDTLPYSPGQLSLFDNTENLFSDLSQYLYRLRNRFGEDSAGFPSLIESHIPERSWKLSHLPTEETQTRHNPNRPLLIYHPPILCKPEKNWQLFPTENLMTEWWEEGGFRKYFIALLPNQVRLWLYWDLETKGFYLHGCFD
jgi:hypothetical protein